MRMPFHRKTVGWFGLCAAVATGCMCARAGEADAVAITATIQSRHLPFGTILDPIFASADSNQIIGYTRCGDSALWTGNYLAAESYRYNVTRAPGALDNVKKALAGLKTLVDVTGTNLLARCAVPVSSPFAAGIQSEESNNGIYTNNSAGLVWVAHTSRDQYSGVMFGLAVAYDMVDDAGVRSSAADLVTRIVDFLNGHGWSVVMPDNTVSTSFLLRGDQILSFLQVARHVNPGRFSTTYDVQRVALFTAVAVPISLEVTNDDSYFKFNLDAMNLFNLVRLESSFVKSNYKGAYDIFRGHTASHKNAFFNMIDRALNGPQPARDAETIALLNQWLQRPRRDQYVDVSGTVRMCGDQACDPVPVPLRPPTDFLWQRNPFQVAGGGRGLIESPGIDYILPYWMARYYGVIAGADIQSAAAPTGSSITPDSIASIFGTGLAAGTAQATSLPLPTSLAGVSVRVRDSAGVERDASLTYVSPGQINLVVPAGLAAGQAQFVVTNTGTPQPLTVTGTIQAVAPTLFSMNGNGTGVAAATAIRVQAADPRVRGPVEVFHCTSASGCVGTPINVGVDAPVYLTLYGTGIRNRSSLTNVKVTIHGVSVPVQYAGPQPEFPGLDQVNVQLPLSLRGSGESNVVLTVDGQTSNAVTITIQ